MTRELVRWVEIARKRNAFCAVERMAQSQPSLVTFNGFQIVEGTDTATLFRHRCAFANGNRVVLPHVCSGQRRRSKEDPMRCRLDSGGFHRCVWPSGCPIDFVELNLQLVV